MQTLHHTDLAARHSLACPSIARELVLIESADEWRTAAPGDRILGGGSNTICREEITTRILCPQYRGQRVIAEDDDSVFLQVEAGEPWPAVAAWSVSEGWYGAENLARIPGSAGAAPVQNIGAYGIELQHILARVQVYDREERRLREIPAADCQFAYRDSRFKHDWRERYIISAIILRLSKRGALHRDYPGLREQADSLRTPADVHAAVSALRQDKLPDPAVEPNAGSFFHNPIVSAAHYAALREKHPEMPSFAAGEAVKIPAAWLIEQCGYKGARDGKVGISEKHALVLTNHGGTATEILAFASEIQQAVHSRYGLTLAIEPTVLA